MKHIFISPHADDVALSCGGRIIANPDRGRDTIVVTVFTSDTPTARGGARQIGKPFADLVNSSRTAEDKAAWASLGISAEYLDLPEAVLRNSFPFALSPFRKDEKLIDQLDAALRDYVVLYPDAIFYFPAGLGHHVDHLACKEAAFRLLDKGVLERVMLYEDTPYCWLKFIRKSGYKLLLRSVALDEASVALAFRPDGPSLMAYLRRKLVPFPRGKKLFIAVWASLLIGNLRFKRRGVKPAYRGNLSPIGVSRKNLAQKQALVFRYQTQIPMLFGAQPTRLFDAYADLAGSEVVMEISRRLPNI